MQEQRNPKMAQRLLNPGGRESAPPQAIKSLKERARDPPLLTELEDFVACELANINQKNLHAELPVYRAAFEKFIEAFERYAPILTRIKEQYENALHDHERVVRLPLADVNEPWLARTGGQDHQACGC